MSRQLPFSLEAEQAVLGGILINPNTLDELGDSISADDFMRKEHREIFLVMQNMYKKSRSIDPVTLIDELVKSGTYDDAGGKEYLKLITETVPSSANVKDYAGIVRDKSLLRSLITTCEGITEDAYSEQDNAEAQLELAEAKIYSIAQQRENKNFVKISEALVDVFNHLNELKTDPIGSLGVPTGFSGLDRVLVGLGKSDLVLIGARPGMGKTSFALNLATNVAKQTKKEVAIFSLEMSTTELASRLLSSEALVDSYKLRSGDIPEEDFQKLAYAACELSETNILIDDSTGITISGMKSKLRRLKNLGLVVIDYLQLMQSERKIDNRVQEVADISRNMKLLAKEFRVPVVCCAQLSRGPEGRTDKRPMLSDLRDSGAIEQDADIVLFLYRDEYYNTDSEKSAEIIVAKNRHGGLENVKMGWLAQYTKYTTLDTTSES